MMRLVLISVLLFFLAGCEEANNPANQETGSATFDAVEVHSGTISDSMIVFDDERLDKTGSTNKQ